MSFSYDATPSGKGRQKGVFAASSKGKSPPSASASKKRSNTTSFYRRDKRPAGGDIYAALDLGTNNCRLLIVRPAGNGFQVIASFSRIVRLGEGLATTGRLSKQAMERTLRALKICKNKMRRNNVKFSALVATQACREAKNGDLFIKRIRDEIGLEIKVIDQEKEVRISVMSCLSLIRTDYSGVLLFDIGGGSSEVVWVDPKALLSAPSHRVSDGIVAWHSIPVGVVSLADRFGGVEVTDEVYDAMVREVESHLESFTASEALAQAITADKFYMLGTSGTMTTLAGFYLNLKRYDRKRVDGLWANTQDMLKTIEILKKQDIKTRIENPCIGKNRADLVLAGCAVFDAIYRRWPLKTICVADRGLREGLLLEMMNGQKTNALSASGQKTKSV